MERLFPRGGDCAVDGGGGGNGGDGDGGGGGGGGSSGGGSRVDNGGGGGGWKLLSSLPGTDINEIVVVTVFTRVSVRPSPFPTFITSRKSLYHLKTGETSQKQIHYISPIGT